MIRRFVVWCTAVLMAVLLTPLPASAADSEIQERYEAEPALANMLGDPTGNEFSVADGRQRNYEWGSLFWSPETGVHEVHGSILWRYKQLGGPSGSLGFPETDEQHIYFKQDVPDQRIGSRNDFEDGAITWSAETGPKWMNKDFADLLPLHTFPDLGIPTSDEKVARNGRVLELGEDARIYKTPTGMFTFTSGYPSGSKGILAKYLELGGHDGFLKLPRSGGTTQGTEGIVQRFEGGDIFQCGYLLGDCGTDEAYVVKGAIRIRFFNEGGLTTLGYPVSDEQISTNGRVSHFQNGSIYWNANTGNTSVIWN